jgi:DNA repair protein RadC
VLTSGAEGFIVVHNHPSGKASPSDADKDLTKAISKAANLFDGDLTFIDHVIVGNGQYYSFYDKKLYRVSEKKRKLKRKAA